MNHEGLAESLKESLQAKNEEYLEQWLEAEERHIRFLDSKQKTKEFFEGCINLQGRLVGLVGNTIDHGYRYREYGIGLHKRDEILPLFKEGDEQLSWIFAELKLESIVEDSRKTKEVVKPRRFLKDMVVTEEFFEDELKYPETPFHKVSINFLAGDSPTPGSRLPLGEIVSFVFPRHMREDVDTLYEPRIDAMFPFEKHSLTEEAPQHVEEYEELAKAVTLIEEALANHLQQR